jgi:hypothetical protein
VSGARGDIAIRGLWTAPCMYSLRYPVMSVKPAFSGGEEADRW